MRTIYFLKVKNLNVSVKRKDLLRFRDKLIFLKDIFLHG